MEYLGRHEARVCLEVDFARRDRAATTRWRSKGDAEWAPTAVCCRLHHRRRPRCRSRNSTAASSGVCVGDDSRAHWRRRLKKPTRPRGGTVIHGPPLLTWQRQRGRRVESRGGCSSTDGTVARKETGYETRRQDELARIGRSDTYEEELLGPLVRVTEEGPLQGSGRTKRKRNGSRPDVSGTQVSRLARGR